MLLNCLHTDLAIQEDQLLYNITCRELADLFFLLLVILFFMEGRGGDGGSAGDKDIK